jgi:hypothetical protein
VSHCAGLFANAFCLVSLLSCSVPFSYFRCMPLRAFRLCLRLTSQGWRGGQ